MRSLTTFEMTTDLLWNGDRGLFGGRATKQTPIHQIKVDKVIPTAWRNEVQRS